MSPLRRLLCHRPTRYLIFLICLLTGLVTRAWDQRRFWTRYNFREVILGEVYAGGFQYPTTLRGIVRQYDIRTVLTLLPAGSDDDRMEQEALRAIGVTFQRIVIPFLTPSGEAFENSEEMAAAQLAAVKDAVAILAKRENQPVFIHCRGGNHRTGAVVAVFRVQHCNWSEADARRELAAWGGFLGNTPWPSDVLHAYCTKSTLRKNEPSANGNHSEFPSVCTNPRPLPNDPRGSQVDRNEQQRACEPRIFGAENKLSVR
jgi:tyrosine-protein phosphatase SIW14